MAYFLILVILRLGASSTTKSTNQPKNAITSKNLSAVPLRQEASKASPGVDPALFHSFLATLFSLKVIRQTVYHLALLLPGAELPYAELWKELHKIFELFEGFSLDVYHPQAGKLLINLLTAQMTETSRGPPSDLLNEFIRCLSSALASTTASLLLQSSPFEGAYSALILHGEVISPLSPPFLFSYFDLSVQGIKFNAEIMDAIVNTVKGRLSEDMRKRKGTRAKVHTPQPYLVLHIDHTRPPPITGKGTRFDFPNALTLSDLIFADTEVVYKLHALFVEKDENQWHTYLRRGRNWCLLFNFMSTRIDEEEVFDLTIKGVKVSNLKATMLVYRLARCEEKRPPCKIQGRRSSSTEVKRPKKLTTSSQFLAPSETSERSKSFPAK